MGQNQLQSVKLPILARQHFALFFLVVLCAFWVVAMFFSFTDRSHAQVDSTFNELEQRLTSPNSAISASEPVTSTSLTLTVGSSVQGRPIVLYRFGDGDANVLLIGGIHGGYEANTTNLSQQLIEYLQNEPEAVPLSVSLFLIPSMNPDGLETLGPRGRVNANGVDLNRNWGCNWKKHNGSYWEVPYSAGTQAFSEPESIAVRDLILRNRFEVIVFYHSQGAYIFYGKCGLNTYSRELARLVSQTTGYALSHPPKYSVTYFGLVTGESTDYVDSLGVPSIGIELSTRNFDQIDWNRNLRGLKAIMSFAEEAYQERISKESLLAMNGDIQLRVELPNDHPPPVSHNITPTLDISRPNTPISVDLSPVVSEVQTNTLEISQTVPISVSSPVRIESNPQTSTLSPLTEVIPITTNMQMLPVQSVIVSASAPCSRDSQGEQTCYLSGNLIDQVDGTAWRTPFPSNVWAEFQFGTETIVSTVMMIGGYDKVDPYDGTDRWCENHRPRDITVSSGGKILTKQALIDTRQPQIISLLNEPATTIRISITSAYPPNSDCQFRPYLAVSQVEFYGKKP